MVNRSLMFYKLLNDYGVGGNFLKILKSIYEDNQIFVKLSHGLTQPFLSTTGVKQGCVLSPLCFNLFINKLSCVYNNNINNSKFCDPVFINKNPINCLMWADDCAIFSLSEKGLQNSIESTSNFFESLGLPVNTQKTKVMVFNVGGLGPKNFQKLNFGIKGSPLEICAKYTYLGLIFKPSGSFVTAQAELYTKACKAWFAISHIVYQNKKMSVDHSLKLLDSIVMPVGLYASEFLTLSALPEGAFKDMTSVLGAWESFPLEKVHQRACRMLLSLHKRASKLACLGELGRHPVLLRGLLQSLKYDWHIRYKASKESLIYEAYQEMSEFASEGNDCWLARV